MNDVTRLNININSDVAEDLRTMATQEGRTITEVVRRAIGVYKFMAYDAEGDIYIEKENGQRDRVLFP